MSIIKYISLNIQQARDLYKESEYKDIKSKLIDMFGFNNLNFKPNPGDVLTNGEIIVMFSKFSESYFNGYGPGILSTFQYNIKEDTIVRTNDKDEKENIVGYKDNFIYADEDQVKLFYSKFSNLK